LILLWAMTPFYFLKKDMLKSWKHS